MLHSAKYCSDPVQLIPPIPIALELLDWSKRVRSSISGDLKTTQTVIIRFI